MPPRRRLQFYRSIRTDCSLVQDVFPVGAVIYETIFSSENRPPIRGGGLRSWISFFSQFRDLLQRRAKESGSLCLMFHQRMSGILFAPPGGKAYRRSRDCHTTW